jgi:hypothetical protein
VVFARIQKLVLVVALMVSIGLHWAVLQSVAWAGMLIQYTRQTSSVPVAFTMTFDGQHPCKLCKVTQQGRKSEQSQNKSFAAQKLELFAQKDSTVVIYGLQETSLPETVALFLSSRGVRPPVPPPRVG